ncbi:MAG: hypothetical protein NVS4B11_20390 [Ktedonobacteraceae bacterium]
MEMRAYLEGIVRKWWLIGLIAVASYIIGGIISNTTTSQYTASATVLLNDKVLANTAFPSNTVQIDTVKSYRGIVDSPIVINRILQSYPRLTLAQLQKNIVVDIDGTSQVMLINVNDISPAAAQDIANYITKHFVNTQTAHLRKQLKFYEQWLSEHIAPLDNEINRLNTEIDGLIPQRDFHTPPTTLTDSQKLTLNEDQAKLDQDTRTRYSYEQSLIEVQQALNVVNKAYIILKPATVPTVPTIAPLPTSLVELITLAVGLLLALILCIMLDFFTSVIRHKGELARIVGVSVLSEVPQLFGFEQKRLLQDRSTSFLRRIKPLRLLCASVSAIAVKKKGHTILLTSPYKKRRFAGIMATFMARKGLHTLLIDADFQRPSVYEQIETSGPGNIKTASGQLLTFINKTTHPELFFLSSKATLAQNQPLMNETLMEMLPELERIFDIIIIDAPPIDSAATHLLVTKVAQVLMLLKKRSDRLQDVKKTRMVCEDLKSNTHYVLLT